MHSYVTPRYLFLKLFQVNSAKVFSESICEWDSAPEVCNLEVPEGKPPLVSPEVVDTNRVYDELSFIPLPPPAFVSIGRVMCFV